MTLFFIPDLASDLLTWKPYVVLLVHSVFQRFHMPESSHEKRGLTLGLGAVIIQDHWVKVDL